MWNGNHFGPTWPEVARFQRRSPSGTLPTRRVAEVSVQKNGNPAGQCEGSGFCQRAFAAYAPSLRSVRYSTFPLTTPPALGKYVPVSVP